MIWYEYVDLVDNESLIRYIIDSIIENEIVPQICGRIHNLPIDEIWKNGDIIHVIEGRNVYSFNPENFGSVDNISEHKKFTEAIVKALQDNTKDLSFVKLKYDTCGETFNISEKWLYFNYYSFYQGTHYDLCDFVSADREASPLPFVSWEENRDKYSEFDTCEKPTHDKDGNLLGEKEWIRVQNQYINMVLNKILQ